MLKNNHKKKFLSAIKASILIFSITVISSSAFAEDTEQVAKKEKVCLPWLYDESYVAYNQEFADQYKFPQENVQPMHEYLRYIELIIRTEFGKPTCYLNFSFKNLPDVFKIPKDSYHRPSFPSSLIPLPGFGWWKIFPKQFPFKTAKNTMWIQVYNAFDRSNPVRNPAIHDIYIQDKYVDIHTQLHMCNITYKYFENSPERNAVLQIERTNPEVKYHEVKYNPELRDKFFESIPLPNKWYWETFEPLKNAQSQRCRNID